MKIPASAGANLGCAGRGDALTSPDMYSDASAVVRKQLAAANVAGEVRVLPEPVPTAAAAAVALGCDVGAIANSLVFEADGAALLVLASGAHRVHLGRLARRINVGKIRRAERGFVAAHTGQEVGGVAPVGHPSPLRTVIDQDLAAYPVLWAGGGDEYTMFATSFDELVQITAGTPADVT
jgi:prolyl-tRNA editing enzyme YbaK/EbsC (Cys-tRNA(Pro) deacylase)